MALYAAAAAVLAGVESRQGSIKGLVYASSFQVAGRGVRVRLGGRLAWAGPRLSSCLSGRAQNVKQLYALVCETQRYSAVLDSVISSAGLLRAEKKLRPHLAKVTGEGCGGRGVGRGRAVSPSEPGPSPLRAAVWR